MQATIANRICAMIRTARIQVLNPPWISSQKWHCAPKIFAVPTDVEPGHVGLARVLQESAHDVPAGDPIALFRRSKKYLGVSEFFGNRARLVPAAREAGIIGNAFRALHLPARGHFANQFGQDWNGIAHAFIQVPRLVRGELVNEHQAIARIEFALESLRRGFWRRRTLQTARCFQSHAPSSIPTRPDPMVRPGGFATGRSRFCFRRSRPRNRRHGRRSNPRSTMRAAVPDRSGRMIQAAIYIRLDR